MKTPDSRLIVVPNSKLTSDKITKFSRFPTRRIDLKVGIGYGDDIVKAKEVLLRLVNKIDERILKEPPAAVFCVESGESSVNLQLRVWVNSGDFWLVTCEGRIRTLPPCRSAAVSETSRSTFGRRVVWCIPRHSSGRGCCD